MVGERLPGGQGVQRCCPVLFLFTPSLPEYGDTVATIATEGKALWQF